MSRSRPEAAPFGRQTALFHWMLHQLEVDRWEDLPLDALKAAERRPWAGAPTPYVRALQHRAAPLRRVPTDTLLRLDARVVDATRAINVKRTARPIHWKYFQYLALLFTELYLERLFLDPEALRAELNDYLQGFNARRGLSLPSYEVDAETGLDPLRRLAYWQATGSGKTLLLHAHYHQFHATLRRNGLPRPDHVLLLTPNRGLSRQHLDDLGASNLRGHHFQKGQLPLVPPDVEVLEITRLREEPGPETVHPAAFEGANLVFVDEGHRGSSSVDGEWRRLRQQLATGGFCFEYSATFAQAALKDPAIADDYGRCVVIDYAYKRFYADGYGKHWRILNVPGEARARQGLQEEESLRAYLTAALTVLFQQRRVHAREPELVKEHNLARPLCIFVGASVTGGAEGRAEQTDIQQVLGFLAAFVHPDERARNEALLAALLDGQLGFHDREGAAGDVFHPQTVFPEVLADGLDASGLYEAILDQVFRTDRPGRLHIRQLSGVSGELALSVGTADPFGVVHVSDVAGLRRRCIAHPTRDRFVLDDSWSTGSLFERLKQPDNQLSILIGSRMFTEGWSSWRVSLIGLLNLGRAPGTQIVQLFGRGVRLKGKDASLQRASPRVGAGRPGSRLSALRVLETLNVFGIRADYMDQFEAELEADDVQPPDPTPAREVTVPVVRRSPLPRLRVVRLPEVAFSRSDQRPTLALDPAVPWVEVDAYPRVQVRDDPGSAGVGLARERDRTSGPLSCFAFVDHDALYGDLAHLRDRQGWTNLSLPRTVPTAEGGTEPLTRSLLRVGGWYRLTAPAWLLSLQPGATPPAAAGHRPLDRRPIWQQLASELVCQYAEQFVQLRLQRYRTERAQVTWVDALSASARDRLLPGDYTLTVPEEPTGLDDTFLAWVETLSDAIGDGRYDAEFTGLLTAFGAPAHLAQPLLAAPDAKDRPLAFRCRPPALNRGEHRFLVDLQEWVDGDPALLRGAELVVMRNESRRGVGFFDAGGFYPDFLLWVIRGDHQHLAFIDPKGIGRITDLRGWSKLRLWQTLQGIESRHAGLEVTLDSWLVSVTPRRSAPTDFATPAQSLAQHVVFQDEPGYIEAMVAAILAR